MTQAEDVLAALRKPVVVLSRALDVEFATPAFADLLARGLAADSTRLGNAVRSTPALSSALGRAIAKLRAVGWTSEARWATGTEDGRIFDIRVVRVQADRFAAVFDDVTHHLRVQEIQTRARSYLEAVLNHVPLGVIVLDSDFNVTYFNDRQGELFRRLGVERSLFEVMGAPVAESYPLLDAEEWQDLHGRVVRAGEMAAPGRVGHPREQPVQYFTINFVPLTRHAEPPSGAICMTDDVTRTVTLERELLEKERLALAGRMTVALTHEINSPLAAVLGVAESLLFAARLQPDEAGRVETILENALQILDVTRRQREIEDAHLAERVEGVPLPVALQGR